MFQDLCFLKEVTDLRKLGTGHKKTRVIVVDESRQNCFPARVLNNRPLTTGKLVFDNNKTLDLRSKTLDGEKVRIFLPTDREWLKQSLILKIGRWLENARPEDVMAFGDSVAKEYGEPQFWSDPSIFVFEKQQIMKRLPHLGLVPIQSLIAMLFAAPNKSEI